MSSNNLTTARLSTAFYALETDDFSHMEKAEAESIRAVAQSLGLWAMPNLFGYAVNSTRSTEGSSPADRP